MGRKKDDDYDPYDDDSDEDDDLHMKGLKLSGASAPKPKGDWQFDPPSKIWHYDYIMSGWKDFLVFKGIGEKRAKSFLSESSLVNGSDNGGVETRWSGTHELWKGTIESTGHEAIFFSGDSITELVDMLCDQIPHLSAKKGEKSLIKPDPKKALQVDSIILPGTLKAVRPTTVAALYDLVESVKGQRFNFMLAECQAHYQSLNEKGGSVLALKTQRYEEMDSLVLEIGWAWETHSGKKRTKDGSEHGNIVDDSAAFRILEENAGYSNGKRYPNERKSFGFSENQKTVPEADVMDEIRKLIADLSSKGPLLLVFHGAATELEYFTQEMQDTRSWMTSCPTSIHKPLQSKGKKDHTSFPVIIQDTQRLFAAYRGDPQYAQVNLKRACEEACLPVPIKHMYNAGNDAYYLLMLFDQLMA